MNIFTVKFWIAVFVDDDKIVEEETETSELKQMDGKFGLGAMDMGEAYEEAVEYLDELLGEDGYHIVSISEIEDLTVVNWPGEGSDCNCVYCRTERAAEEDKIAFNCSCNYIIKVVDDFDMIYCPQCQKQIFRDRIIGNNRSGYTLMNIDGEGGI